MNRFDPLAALAALVTTAMVAVYLAIIREQGNDAAWWFVAALVLGAAAAGYGALRGTPRRAGVLLLAGVVLAASGLLGILTIGLPILIASVLCLVAAGRADRADRADRAPEAAAP